jgi:hypothetical protein
MAVEFPSVNIPLLFPKTIVLRTATVELPVLYKNWPLIVQLVNTGEDAELRIPTVTVDRALAKTQFITTGEDLSFAIFSPKDDVELFAIMHLNKVGEEFSFIMPPSLFPLIFRLTSIGDE